MGEIIAVCVCGWVGVDVYMHTERGAIVANYGSTGRKDDVHMYICR